MKNKKFSGIPNGAANIYKEHDLDFLKTVEGGSLGKTVGDIGDGDQVIIIIYHLHHLHHDHQGI